MSSKDTPSKPSTKSKGSRERRRKRKVNSRGSNASIISIDYASLKKLRKFQEKVAKENQKQSQIYHAQKRSQFEDYTKKFMEADKELKEEQEEDTSSFDVTKPSDVDNYSAYDSSASSQQTKENSTANGMADITVEELLPIIKKLVDEHNNLQQEYDILLREYEEQKIVMEDRISQLQMEGAGGGGLAKFSDTNLHSALDQGGAMMAATGGMSASQRQKLIQDYEDKLEMMTSNYNNNLMSMEGQYKQQMDTLEKRIKSLNKDLHDADKENDALRQSLDALEHENQSLRISMNDNNKQFQNVKLMKKKNKELELENETLRQQLESMEQDLDLLMEQQQQQQQQVAGDHHLNEPHLQSPNRGPLRPHTPTHNYTKTLIMGNRDALEVGSNKGSLHNFSDHESSLGGNDLLHQLGAEYHEFQAGLGSSADPPDRGSNYEDDDRDDDEEGAGDQNDAQHEEKKNDADDDINTLANLAKYKNIAEMDPASMHQIMQLLQDKETKRLQTATAGHSQRSQDVIDQFSVESNYSDSEQKLEEQIDAMEDDIRELKDMILSLMDTTNNITPQINSGLGPLVRKINRMYLMLSGPMQSRTAYIRDDGSLADGHNNRSPLPFRGGGAYHDEEQELKSNQDGADNRSQSQYSHAKRDSSELRESGWIAW
eukprot:CAMPEP_0197031378 /NCGR_PEP_ID=MMETSP1384-20130603/10398_1 /TAXON_ID=29189 /ORGANISM="Ammonia sp." /LENGTH=657 /DNA_ID=CAMNT_0042460895 /DNA_START=182 /DNA_END=2152 /DNA_ORIENTATION=+